MKRTFLLASIALCICFFLSACAVRAPGVKFPEPTSGFEPQKLYKVPYDDMWTRVKRVLETDRITIASSSKEEGRIATDYLEGPGYVDIVTDVAYNTRYKYNLIFEKIDEGTTRLNVICALEQKSTMFQDWRDISKSKKAQAVKLENWLLERIEKSP